MDAIRKHVSVAFNTGCVSEARRMVETYHYSKRWPSNVQVCATMHEPGGLFGDIGEAVAACLFTFPPTRWSDEVMELARLVRNEKRQSLTPLIAFACKQAKMKGADLLVSFADNTHGHHGGIYQAASWSFGGLREPTVDGVVIDGCFHAGRSCNSKWGTRSPAKLSTMLGVDVLPHVDEGKYLYWRALNKQGKRKAERLGLQSLPYPKPQQAALL